MADEIVLHVTEANYEDTVVKCDKRVSFSNRRSLVH